MTSMHYFFPSNVLLKLLVSTLACKQSVTLGRQHEQVKRSRGFELNFLCCYHREHLRVCEHDAAAASVLHHSASEEEKSSSTKQN